jgi:hypothetical protein
MKHSPHLPAGEIITVWSEVVLYFFAGAAAGAAAATLAFLSPLCPWKVRVGANSPSL